MCPCNTTPQAPGCWNVLTTVNCCPLPLLTLSSSRVPEGALRRSVPAYKAETVWFLSTPIVGSPFERWCCVRAYWRAGPWVNWTSDCTLDVLSLLFQLGCVVGGCLLQTVQNNACLWIYTCVLLLSLGVSPQIKIFRYICRLSLFLSTILQRSKCTVNQFAHLYSGFSSMKHQ